MGTIKDKMMADYMSAPVEVGTHIEVKGKYLQTNTNQSGEYYNDVYISAINEDGTWSVRRKDYAPGTYHGETSVIDPNKAEWRRDTIRVGVNPIANDDWHTQCRRTGLGLSHILFKIETDFIESENKANVINGIQIKEISLDPWVLNDKGEKIYFQRDYVWTLEDEQLFIESIYNHLSLGTIVMRKRSFKWVEQTAQSGETDIAYYDVVDGKQRIHTLYRFMTDQFPDLNGNYYSDFSELAVRQFRDAADLDIFEIQENATDATVLQIFLNVNFAGRPMSKEHIDFVKEIYTKDFKK